ncbi:MAG TPA: bifunctional hydroxymethylpyrimidine kinase/phosphomethylpyrimidine kinase [Candidatus Mediterraneibacter faecipullorum]|uniref:Hydroxymethylpyrimidine/phosphomethylpyrimidine kinase n=1 Tax=Candidatus Mediterraneibacter faecipullorum TaxID=2838670 RepID=A0A9D2NLM9_9FIRM|nr:bifunctional hydroxymethylpyrimidine kinase/phosphomethylpyrimidine kinase [Candidatus Mediterraneibacter faecipullorum]
MRTALTIAGSDSSGGAGIQADIKTMTANGVFAMSAITALTAQNTTGVAGIMEASPEFLKQQIDCIFTDIRPDAVKIGMVSSAELIIAIAEKLAEYQAENIVVDPVMVATSGAKLISDDAIDTLKERLLPMADILTPNIPESEVLSGMEIRTEEDMIKAAEKISENYHCAVLLKGGHQLNDANDLLYRKGSYRWFYGKRIDNPNTHGTGCTLSSAIASNLAKGFDMDTSVERAKAYISGALGAMLDLGKGSGPMNHAFDITGEYVKTPEDIAKGTPENTVTESAMTGTDMPSAGKETV